MSLTIVQFRCRTDNYGVLVHDERTRETASVDAPDADAVRGEIERRGWRLDLILTTHHHTDHVAGNRALKDAYGCRVVGPSSEAIRIPGLDAMVDEGSIVPFADRQIRVMATPGHTLGHVSYYLPDDQTVFVGDTLFAMGCGRLFEGTPEMMWASLVRLRGLPETTQVYCGHDYAAQNARFALTIEPDNPLLAARATQVAAQRAAGGLTPPTSIGTERRTNPFLRADQPGMNERLQMAAGTPTEVFAEIRRRKDAFG
jgi:hydroxyacylglutathione hydrolase